MSSNNDSDGSAAPQSLKKNRRTRNKQVDALNRPLKHCPLCNFSSSTHILRHIEKHDNLLNKDSAKALTSIQSSFATKGFKLVRMMDIKNILGNLWYSSDGRKIAYRICQLGQLVPWNGKWNIPGVVDPTDLVSAHITAESSVNSMCDITHVADPIDLISTQLTPESSVSMIVDVPANILRESSVEIEPSVQIQRVDEQIPKLARNQTLRVLNVARLQDKLSDNHKLIVFFRDALKDRYKHNDLQNCLGSIRRVFFYVDDILKKAGTPAKHWSDLLLQHQLVIEYLDKRLAYNATVWTIRTYKKHIISQYEAAIFILPLNSSNGSLVKRLEDSIGHIKNYLRIDKKQDTNQEVSNVQQVEAKRFKTSQHIEDGPEYGY